MSQQNRAKRSLNTSQQSPRVPTEASTREVRSESDDIQPKSDLKWAALKSKYVQHGNKQKIPFGTEFHLEPLEAEPYLGEILAEVEILHGKHRRKEHPAQSERFRIHRVMSWTPRNGCVLLWHAAMSATKTLEFQECGISVGKAVWHLGWCLRHPDDRGNWEALERYRAGITLVTNDNALSREQKWAFMIVQIALIVPPAYFLPEGRTGEEVMDAVWGTLKLLERLDEDLLSEQNETIKKYALPVTAYLQLRRRVKVAVRDDNQTRH